MSTPLRVLIVEDSEDDALLVKWELERGGYAVTDERVETAEQMRAALARQKWDSIISDFGLPQFNGLEALELFKQSGLDIPFILVSGTIGEETAAATMKAGAHDYLMKGNLKRLVPSIARELREAQVRQERKRAEDALREREERFRSLIEAASDIIVVLNTDGTLRYASPSSKRLLGYAPAELQGKSLVELIHPDDLPIALSAIAHRIENPGLAEQPDEFRVRHADGAWRDFEAIGTNLLDNPAVAGIVVNAHDVTDRKRAEEETRRHAARAEALVRAAARLNAQLDLAAVLNAVCEETARALNVPAASVTRFNPARGEFAQAAAVGLPDDYRQHHQPIPVTLYNELAQNAGAVVVVPDAQQLAHSPNAELYARHNVRTVVAAKMEREGALFGTLNAYALGATRTFTANELASLQGLADQAAQAIANARLFEQEQTRRAELSALYDLSRALLDANHFDAILDLVTRRAVEIIRVTFAHIVLLEHDQLVVRAAYPIRALDRDLQIGRREPLSAHPLCRRILEENRPMLLHANTPEAAECQPFLLNLAQTLCIVPLRVGDPSTDTRCAIGLLMLGEAREEAREPFDADKLRLARNIADQAASALHRETLRDQTEQRLERIGALHSIDTAITSSFDLRFTLNVVLDQVIHQLRVDAASVLLLNPLQTLEFAAGRGFRSQAIERSRLRLGEGHAGRAALERHIVSVPDLRAAGAEFVRAPLLAGEAFASYHSAPLVAKGQVKGVLEAFHRTPLDPDPEWLSFFETLAGQAAIAMDNAGLFSDLQRANVDLTLAYDATIEGWSRALDLRDRETEGHTLRVAETTERLARAMGFGGAELVHVRRGALLHDIGKMGIPDSILLKPGALTDEEWVTMRKHPEYAYELLAPIAYLRPVLDIPYCHHEKRDGSGYPRGLKGEEIPLAARVFAIVDVWDALTSDRPYRPAWSPEKAREHIRASSGTHFDPRVVEAFLRMEG